jgi:hypothetical protein
MIWLKIFEDDSGRWRSVTPTCSLVLSTWGSNTIFCFGFEVLAAVSLKRAIFWNIMNCIPVKVNRRFAEICTLHLRDRRLCQVRNQYAASRNRLLKQRRHVPPKRRLTFIGIRGVITQKIELLNSLEGDICSCSSARRHLPPLQQQPSEI